MGLLNFWKKKALEQPTPPYAGAETLTTDLPSIDSGSFDGSNIQQFNGMQQLPPLDDQGKDGESKSISFNVPPFDFSLPPSDELGIGSTATAPASASMPSFSEFGLPLDNTPSTFMSTIPQTTTANTGDISLGDTGDIDVEDLNKLFISDDWKEPDWNNFEPYPEETIDEPKPEDFKGAELPTFDEQSGQLRDVSQTGQSTQLSDDEPVLEPNVPSTMEQNRPSEMPVELFIRGKAYNRVFIELDQMNKTLTRIDAQVGSYEDMLKREEPLLVTAKDQMEYLYRKLNQVDKKIFAQ